MNWVEFHLFADSEICTVDEDEVTELGEDLVEELLQGRKVVEGLAQEGEEIDVGEEEKTRRITPQRPECGREQSLSFLINV